MIAAGIVATPASAHDEPDDGRLPSLADSDGATHSHADDVTPGWSRRLKRNDVIGRYVFHQSKPNRT